MERACNPQAALWLVITFAILHGLIWTDILIKLKAAQDVHMDVAEGFAWGQKFQLGYGKHPPLAGWIAGLWFRFFPVADWATYALAMTTLAVGLVILMIEWMSQQHYLGSIRDDGDLDPLFKSLLKNHWMEEAQHAKLIPPPLETRYA